MQVATKSDARISNASACAVLKNPIRVRILEVLDERDMSPVQFVREGLLPHLGGFKTTQNALSHVAYHFRVLEKASCIEVVGRHQRRGATENVFRGIARAEHSDEEFADLSFDERRQISRTTFQSLVARAESAIMSGTFDSRPDRHLSWVALELDEEGWEQLRALQAETLARTEAIKAEAAERIAETGSESFRATCGALAFESSPAPGAKRGD
jgi:DNA-binding transcriptional ArsR family regulator